MATFESSVLADGLGFLESARWRDGVLWMSDLVSRKVLTISPDGSLRTIVDVPGIPSGLCFLPDGTPLVVSMNDRRLYRIEGARLVLYADLSAITPLISDMIIDTRGRIYVDAYGYNMIEGEEEKPSSIVLVEPNGRMRVVAEDMNIPNGPVFTSDGRLVIAESWRKRLCSFAVADDGSLYDRQVYVDLDGTPDGICLDIDDGIWVSMAFDRRFVRVQNGRIVDTVVIEEGRMAISCQLGGEDGRTLFCLTYKGKLEDILTKPGARVETVRVKAPGAGSP